MKLSLWSGLSILVVLSLYSPVQGASLQESKLLKKATDKLTISELHSFVAVVSKLTTRELQVLTDATVKGLVVPAVSSKHNKQGRRIGMAVLHDNLTILNSILATAGRIHG